jgi:hypothetical protein
MLEITKKHISPESVQGKTQGKPDVVILLDSSSSMSPYREKVISTFNEYVASVKETANTISLYQFYSDYLNVGHIIESIYKENPSRIKKLGYTDYCPNGGTPLYDAMGTLIKKFESSKRNVQFVTHTDGEENTSKEWLFETLNAYITAMTARGWLFTYLGEGLGARTINRFDAGLKFNYSPNNRESAMRNFAMATSTFATTSSNQLQSYTSNLLGIVDIDKNETVTPLTQGQLDELAEKLKSTSATK